MTTEIKNREDLAGAIAVLEKKTSLQENIISNAFFNLGENLKPINLIKKHKEIFLIAVLGLGAGFFIRKLLLKTSTGLVAKMAGTLIQWGLAGMLTKNAGRIRANAGPVARRVLNRKKPATQIISVQAR
jgi:hypothetical protein